MSSLTVSFPKDPHQDGMVITTDQEADKMIDPTFNYNAAPSADQGFGFVYEGYGAKIKTKSEFDDEAAARFVESATKQETASERVAKTLIGAASGVAVVGMAIWRLAGRKHPKATFVPKTSFAGNIKGMRPVIPRYAMRPYRARWNKK